MRWLSETGLSANEVVRTCSVITTTPNRALAAIHNRMPVVLAPEVWNTWLDPTVDDNMLLGDLLKPAPDDLLEIVKVGKAVNNVRNKGPECLEPPDEKLFDV